MSAKCFVCKSNARPNKSCKKCHKAQYCSSDCRREDHKLHRLVCELLTSENQNRVLNEKSPRDLHQCFFLPQTFENEVGECNKAVGIRFIDHAQEARSTKSIAYVLSLGVRNKSDPTLLNDCVVRTVRVKYNAYLSRKVEGQVYIHFHASPKKGTNCIIHRITGIHAERGSMLISARTDAGNARDVTARDFNAVCAHLNSYANFVRGMHDQPRPEDHPVRAVRMNFNGCLDGSVDRYETTSVLPRFLKYFTPIYIAKCCGFNLLRAIDMEGAQHYGDGTDFCKTPNAEELDMRLDVRHFGRKHEEFDVSAGGSFLVIDRDHRDIGENLVRDLANFALSMSPMIVAMQNATYSEKKTFQQVLPTWFMEFCERIWLIRSEGSAANNEYVSHHSYYAQLPLRT